MRDGRKSHGAEAVHRRCNYARKSPVVGKQFECCVDARPVDESESQAEPQSVAGDELKRRRGPCSQTEADSHHKAARGNDGARSEAVVDPSAEDHWNGAMPLARLKAAARLPAVTAVPVMGESRSARGGAKTDQA